MSDRTLCVRLMMPILVMGLTLAGCRPAPKGRIAFASVETGYWELYTMEPDGSDVTRLTYLESSAHNPAWSPDGTRIVFSFRQRDEYGAHLYVMDADGDNLMRVTSEEGSYRPTWSPDGARIAFDRDGQVYVVDVAEGTETRLTHKVEEAVFPSWSPDGDHIACACWLPGDEVIQICVIDIEGEGIEALTGQDKSSGYPAWSPDGTKIAFSSTPLLGRHCCSSDIYVMNNDGTDVIQLTDSPDNRVNPSWSPDGRYIVFECMEGQICRVSSDGRQEIQLTDSEAKNSSPAWSPVLE